jgi:uncharacterized repeat protein (TIGR01451 family)
MQFSWDVSPQVAAGCNVTFTSEALCIAASGCLTEKTCDSTASPPQIWLSKNNASETLTGACMHHWTACFKETNGPITYYIPGYPLQTGAANPYISATDYASSITNGSRGVFATRSDFDAALDANKYIGDSAVKSLAVKASAIGDAMYSYYTNVIVPTLNVTTRQAAALPTTVVLVTIVGGPQNQGMYSVAAAVDAIKAMHVAHYPNIKLKFLAIGVGTTVDDRTLYKIADSDDSAVYRVTSTVGLTKAFATTVFDRDLFSQQACATDVTISFALQSGAIDNLYMDVSIAQIYNMTNCTFDKHCKLTRVVVYAFAYHVSDCTQTLQGFESADSYSYNDTTSVMKMTIGKMNSANRTLYYTVDMCGCERAIGGTYKTFTGYTYTGKFITGATAPAVPTSDNITVRAAPSCISAKVIQTVMHTPWTVPLTRSVRVGDAIVNRIQVLNSGLLPFSVSKDGAVGVIDVSDDDITDVIKCAAPTTGIKERLECNSTHLITQAELANGTVYSQVCINGTAVDNTTVSVPNTCSSLTLRIPKPALEPLIITNNYAVATVRPIANTPITYTYKVKNAGQSALALNWISSVSGLSTEVLCGINTLSAGNATTCMQRYNLTLDDINHGMLVNNVTLNATIVGSSPAEYVVRSNTSTIMLKQTSSVTVSSSVVNLAKTSPVRAGDLVPVVVTITNTGNVSALHKQSALQHSELDVTWRVLQLEFVHAQQIMCTPRYLCNAIRPLKQCCTPLLSLLLSCDTYTALQTGLFDLGITHSAMKATDPMPECIPSLRSQEYNSSVTGASGFMPLDRINCTLLYNVSQAEVDAGRWMNETIITASTLNGTDVCPVINGTKSLSICKANIGRTWLVAGSLNMSVATRYEGNMTAAVNGSSIRYRITVTNNGTTTLNDVAATILAPTVPINAASVPVCGSRVLAPDASTTCNSTQIITPANIIAVQVLNTVSASAAIANSTTLKATARDTTNVTLVQSTVMAVTNSFASRANVTLNTRYNGRYVYTASHSCTVDGIV